MNDSGIYCLVEAELKFNLDWKVITYESYWEYILKNIINDNNDLNNLIKYANKNPQREQFKWVCEIGTMQFLVGVFPKERTIRIASKQLNNELMLINFQENFESKKFIELKHHCQAIAEIPIENSPTVIEFISCKFELPLFNEGRFEEIHQYSAKLSKGLIGKIGMYRLSLFEKLTNFGLDLTANFMLIRIHLLKFLAILPNLDHDKNGDEVKRIFLETLRRLIQDSQLASIKMLRGQKKALPYVYIFTCKALQTTSKFIPASILAYLLRLGVGMMAQRFIAGENIDKATNSLKELLESGRGATIDQLGELVVSNKEADEYCEKVIEIIEGLEQSIPKGSKNKAGLNMAHVSIKVSALCNDFKPQDFDYTYKNVYPRLCQILLSAKKHDVFINIDAEHYHYRDIIFDVYSKTLKETKDLSDFSQTGIVLQAYLRDAYTHFIEIVDLAKKRGMRMPIRLVKGAYWDAETIEAEAHNFLAPQFLNKEETDIHFRQLIFKCLEHHENIQLAVASHNIQDHCFAEALRERKFELSPVIEHQCLHMTYEGLSVGLSKMDWPTRNYIPVGNLLVGMAYLVRRIMENSSQVGVLTIMRSHKKELNPKVPTQILKGKKEKQLIVYDSDMVEFSKSFKNIYPIRTYKKEHFQSISTRFRSDFSDIKNGKMFYDLGDKNILCSSDPSLVLGTISYDSVAVVNQKIDDLFHGHNNGDWKDSKNINRFACLSNLAELMLMRREELTSLIMLEAGKTIDEAIADVDEAIDFINFYSREQITLIQGFPYESRGVVGVIAPWNFPLAIATGMSVSALAAGNAVILKPAEQTPLIAIKLLELCHEAGIPKDIIQISLGEAEVGKAIVDNELVVGIVFTGSKMVGESIYKKISKELTSSKYPYSPIPKFAITEMGGKNAIIITNNSELDETVSGVIYSAFAHSGQKCSAASRIIIDEKLKEPFIKRFSNAVNDLVVGGATDFSTVVNPLITKEDQDRVKSMAIRAKEEVLKYNGRIIVDESQKSYPGYCVGPSVFELASDITLKHKTVASEEVFGPLIHLISYKNIDEAIQLFNSTEYALTGGLFCQSQDDIDYIVPKLEAGNIYINRPNTGARVAIEPFGGFKMSGTGPKAGGTTYMYTFNRIPSIAKKAVLSPEDYVEIKEYMAHASKLTHERRVFNSKQLVNLLINQFEVFFQNISEQDKKRITELGEAFQSSEFDLTDKQFPNRYIPGQISFNKKNLSRGSGIFVDLGEELEINSIIDFLINITVGNGISIIATNQTIYDKWKTIIDLTQRCGYSSFNVSLSLYKMESLKSLFRDGEYEFVIFSSIKIDEELKGIIFSRDFNKHLVRVYYSGDYNHWSQGIDRFTQCRSFAINTMRHGAPLELTL